MPKPKINNLFEPLSILDKVNSIAIPAPMTMFGKPQGSFIETLKSITSSWKDSYKQSSLIEYTAKTDKAPPPADMFANLPS